jgi:glycosyltransferase involved in cell wall biosynthesis
VKVALIHDHVGGVAGGGGGVRLMLQLGTELQQRGHRVTVCCHDYLAESEFASLASQLDVRAVRTGLSDPPPTPAAFMRRYLTGMRKVAALVPDDVDIVNPHESPGLAGGRIAADRLDAPLVWVRNDETFFERATVPELALISDNRPHWRVARALFGTPEFRDARRCDAIVVLANAQVEMVARSYARPAHVINLGPDPYFFRPADRNGMRERLGIAAGEVLALATSILYPHRRFEDFVDAFAQVPDAPELRGLIWGSDKGDPGYADLLAERIARQGLGERMRFERTTIPDEQLRDLYAAADVFVYPNQRQTWGLAPLEAIACGTPVILSRSAGVHDLLGGHPGVLSVDPEQPEQIAVRLREVLAAPDLRATTEPTREWLRTDYTPARYAERMEAVFEESLRRRSAAS